MPAPDMKNLRVTSNAFDLLRDKEKQAGGRITIDTVARETGLAKLTVRRFLDKEEDVNGSTLGAAAIMADYLGVPVGQLINVQKLETRETQEAAA